MHQSKANGFAMPRSPVYLYVIPFLSQEARKPLCNSVFTPSPDALPIDEEEIRHRHHESTDGAEDRDGVVHPEALVEGDGDFDHAADSDVSLLPSTLKDPER